MSSRKAFALRIDEKVLTAMHRWAEDDLRSLNAQIEFALRKALLDSGRVKLVERVVTGTVENILLKPSTKEAIMAWAMSLPCLLTRRPRTPTLPSSPVA